MVIEKHVIFSNYTYDKVQYQTIFYDP